MDKFQIKVLEEKEENDFKYLDIILEGDRDELITKFNDIEFVKEIGIDEEDHFKLFQLIKIED